MSDPNGTLARFVRWVMRDTLYHAQYICTVQSQDADGNLDLLPDDERIRGTGLSRVPIRYGIPGVKARVVAGARVTLAFEAGDPRRPFAALWDPGAIEEISFNDGRAPVARVGDYVTVFWPASCFVQGTLGVLPFTGTMTITSPSVGIIRGGSPKVLA
ncbi:MAG: hypothetical protein DIU78_012885 [Pseudomonadota bacterium]